MSALRSGVVAVMARFGLPEAKVGVFPMQVLVFLAQMIGQHATITSFGLTGRSDLRGPRAYEIGHRHYVVPFEELDSTNRRAVTKLGEMSPVAFVGASSQSRPWRTWLSRRRLPSRNADLGHRAHPRYAAEGFGGLHERRPPRVESVTTEISDKVVPLRSSALGVTAWGRLAKLIGARCRLFDDGHLAEVTMSLLARAQYEWILRARAYPPEKFYCLSEMFAGARAPAVSRSRPNAGRRQSVRLQNALLRISLASSASRDRGQWSRATM